MFLSNIETDKRGNIFHPYTQPQVQIVVADSWSSRKSILAFCHRFYCQTLAAVTQLIHSSKSREPVIITVRKRSCGKVMFLHLSVILFTRGVSASGSRENVCLWVQGVYTPWADTPCRDDHWSGRYASYWNAFLLTIKLYATSVILTTAAAADPERTINSFSWPYLYSSIPVPAALVSFIPPDSFSYIP